MPEMPRLVNRFQGVRRIQVTDWIEKLVRL